MALKALLSATDVEKPSLHLQIVEVPFSRKIQSNDIALLYYKRSLLLKDCFSVSSIGYCELVAQFPK